MRFVINVELSIKRGNKYLLHTMIKSEGLFPFDVNQCVVKVLCDYGMFGYWF